MPRHSTSDILAGSSTRTRDIAYEYVMRLPSRCIRIQYVSRVHQEETPCRILNILHLRYIAAGSLDRWGWSQVLRVNCRL